MNAQFQMVEMLGGYDELDSIAKSIAGPVWDFDPALKTSEQLLAEGITWTYETVDARTLLALDPDISTENALRAAAESWEKAWSGSPKPQLFWACATTNPDRWLLAATDGTEGTEGQLDVSVVQRVTPDTRPDVDVLVYGADEIRAEDLAQFTKICADAAQQMSADVARQFVDMPLVPSGTLWTLDDGEYIINLTVATETETPDVMSALAALWARVMPEGELPHTVSALPTVEPTQWLVAAAHDDEENNQVAVVHLCTNPSVHLR